MSARIRLGTPDDAALCGRICYEAFAAIASAHGFPPDFPSPDVATGLMTWLFSNPGFYGVVAELDGRVAGSNFLDERSAVAGVGPITVDPGVQNATISRQLMMAVMNRAAERSVPGVRLLQSAYHNRSLALYAKLGFAVRESVACLQGAAVGVEVPGHAVRAATEADLDACNLVCRNVHGHDRAGELRDAVGQGSALVVEHDGRVSGYSTGLAFFSHSVGETVEDVKALIGAAREFEGPGILVPARNSDLLQWCLRHGLRVIQLMTLMTLAMYNEPTGAYLPSVLY